MIDRWHLDLLAVSILVGVASIVLDAIAARRARSAPTDVGPAQLARAPALVIGLALMAGDLIGAVHVPALAVLALLAGMVGCRGPLITIVIGALFLSAPAVEGYALPTWLLILLGIVLALVLPGPGASMDDRGPRFVVALGSRIGLGPGSALGRGAGVCAGDGPASGTALLPFLLAAVLWTAAPDTELPLVAAGALLAPAARDLAAGGGLQPDPVATTTVVIATAIGFVGRPAGAVVLALIVPLRWIADGPTTRIRIGATAAGLGVLLVAARTGGLRHRLGAAIPPTAAAGVVLLVLLAVTIVAERPRRSEPTVEASV